MIIADAGFISPSVWSLDYLGGETVRILIFKDVFAPSLWCSVFACVSFSRRKESGGTNLPSAGCEKKLRREKIRTAPQRNGTMEMTAFSKAGRGFRVRQ